MIEKNLWIWILNILVSVKNSMNSKYYLMDVVAIRLLLIFFLVFYHAFAIYLGTWESPYPLSSDKTVDFSFYYWLAKLSHGFQLEAMTFISGLLLGYTIKQYPERLNFNGCIIKKVKRILLPCIIFSVPYYIIFLDLSEPWCNIAYSVFEGCGHLWYLPMIFWCFVFCYLIEKYFHFPIVPMTLIIAVISLLPLEIYLPFRLGYTTSFFVYFFMGYTLMKHEWSNKMVLSSKFCLSLILFYCTFGIVLHDVLLRWSVPNFPLLVFRIISMRFLHFVSAVSMIVALYGIANKSIIQNFLSKHQSFITISGYCYGVYIFQQFILKYLYYKTSLPMIMDEATLPWIALIITLFLSLALCHLTLKTKLGRFLIG